MAATHHNPAELFPRYGNYSHAVEVRGESRLLFISGLNGYLADGKTMPLTFDEQADVIWGHSGNSKSRRWQPHESCVNRGRLS